jgi:hypothetical protein
VPVTLFATRRREPAEGNFYQVRYFFDRKKRGGSGPRSLQVIQNTFFVAWRLNCIFLGSSEGLEETRAKLGTSFGKPKALIIRRNGRSEDDTLRNSRAGGAGTWNLDECSEFTEQSDERVGAGPDERVGNGFGERFAAGQSGSIGEQASFKDTFVEFEVGVGLG